MLPHLYHNQIPRIFR